MLMARQGSGHPGAVRRQWEEMLGSVAAPCVTQELAEVVWVGGTAVVCVGAALCGFCGELLSAAWSAEHRWSPARRFALEGTVKPVGTMGLAETLLLL